MSSARVLSKSESICLLHDDLTACRASLQTALHLLEKANRSIACWRDYASFLSDLFFESKAMMSSYWMEDWELRCKALDMPNTATTHIPTPGDPRRRDETIRSIVTAKVEKLMQVEREEYESEIKAMQDALRELSGSMRRAPSSCRSTSSQTAQQGESDAIDTISLALEMKDVLQETALELRRETFAICQEHCAAALVSRDAELRRQRAEARVERYKLNQRIEMLENTIALQGTACRNVSDAWAEGALSFQQCALHFGECTFLKSDALCDAIAEAHCRALRNQTIVITDLQRRLDEEHSRHATRRDAVLESSQLFAMVEEYEDSLTQIETKIAHLTLMNVADVCPPATRSKLERVLEKF